MTYREDCPFCKPQGMGVDPKLWDELKRKHVKEHIKAEDVLAWLLGAPGPARYEYRDNASSSPNNIQKEG